MGKSYWLKDEDQKGNFTNDKKDTFDPRKRYIGVRLQQGVPLLDRDWNELEDIRRYEEMITRREYIGNGSPDGGFKISAVNNSDPESPDNINNFKIGAGRCLVNGLEAINEPSSILYTDQKNVYLKIDALAPPTDKDERIDTVYLDVWIKEVRSPDTSQGETDIEKVDSSLGNADDVKVETSIRHKLVWCVRVDEGSKGDYKISTGIRFVDYQYTDSNWGKYPVIDSFSGECVPLKRTDASKLAKLVLDSKKKHELNTGEKLNLGSGYALEAKQVDVEVVKEVINEELLTPLEAKQVDVEGNKVCLEFTKDGEFVDDEIVTVTSSPGGGQGQVTNTWDVILDSILGEDGITVLRVHVNQVFQGEVDRIAQIQGIWLIDYSNPMMSETNYESGHHFYYDIARIKRKKGINKILDSDIEDLRTGRGKNGPDKITTQSLTFKNSKVEIKKWPKLTCEAANQVNLSGDLIIKDSGNIGIGTADIKRQLHVEGSNSEIHSGGSGAGFSFANRSTNSFVNSPSDGERWVWYSREEPGIACLWSGKDLMSIDKDGNVGIGTYKPSEKLEVEGNIIVRGQVVQEFWKSAKFTEKGGWQNYSHEYNPAGYFLDKNGIVHLRGLVKSGKIGETIFTLPEGYRPRYRELHMVPSADSTARCDITSSGNVIAVYGDNKWFSLDGITFRVAVIPKVYVANGGSSVVVIDTATNIETAKVIVGGMNEAIAATPDGTKVYVADFVGNTISVIDTATYNVLEKIEVGEQPLGISVTPDGSKVYVANNRSSNMSVIDTATNNVITIPVEKNPHHVAVSPDGSKVYVAHYAASMFSVIDTKTNDVITSFRLISNPTGLSVAPDGKKVYVAIPGARQISVIDTADNKVTGTVSVDGDQPYDIAVTPDGKKAYITSFGSNFYVVDLETYNNVVVNIGSNLSKVSVVPDGTKVYAANSDMSVTVIDTVTNNVIAKTKPIHPVGFAICPVI